VPSPLPGGPASAEPPTVRRGGGLAAAFGHALRGLREVAGERNMRIHLLAGTAVGLVGTELPLPPASRLALHLCTALVIAAEALNSALEALVDLHTVELHPQARRAKDAAAGAVLVLAVGAVLVAGVVGVDAWGAFAAWLARPGWVLALVLDGALLLGMALLQFAPRGPGWWRPALLAVLGLLLVAAFARSASVTLTAQAAALVVLAGVSGWRGASGRDLD
jgi:diacylglycerol kinase (ATP)